MLTVGVAIGVALLLEAFVVKPYKIPTSSMEPTLAMGSGCSSTGSTEPEHRRHRRLPSAGGGGSGDADLREPRQGVADGYLPLLQPCNNFTPRESSQVFIKRVVGLPGDVLQIVKGHVIRNGHREHDRYIRPCPAAAVCTFKEPITVPTGTYYVMGDNRGVSDDSRFWGPVPRRWIIGVAFASYWPPDRIGTL